MYPGWMVIGTQDPIGEPGDFTEIVNNPRAFAYAMRSGICWLQDCNECDPAALVIPGWPFVGVKEDPAPWYDPDNPDSWGFLGVVGLDVTGEDSSTRLASVTMGLNNIGTIGPTYMAPRTMVVRALAIATDDCSLKFGMTWLRAQYATQHNPCGGDTMTFFDCCPCVCVDADMPTDCWAENYGELAAEPACDHEWWPELYGDLLTGPPETSDEWCNWITNYRQLNTGPPQWSCCVNDCVAPYYRQFYNVRVTEGPMVLQTPALNSPGALSEIEFTIVAADPVVHGEPTRVAMAMVTGTEPVVEAPPEPPPTNPYAPVTTMSLMSAGPEAPTAEWVRDTLTLRHLDAPVLTRMEPRIRIVSAVQSGEIRVGLWAGSTRVAGWLIPFVAAGSQLVIAGRDAYYQSALGYERLPTFVRDWDGKWPSALSLPFGDYTVTVDQHPAEVVELLVDVLAVPVGSA